MDYFPIFISVLVLWWRCAFISSLGFSEINQFPAPIRLLYPLNQEFRQINNGNPPEPYTAARKSLQLNQIGVTEAAADKILEDIQAGLRYVLETNNEWTFAIHGTGTTAVHAVMDNMIEREDTVLVLVNGYWSEMIANISMRLGANTVQFRKEAGSRFTLKEIESQIVLLQPKILAVVHGESSTTVLQPLEGLGNLCRRYGVYLVVDSISVVGIQPIKVDHFEVDCSIHSSQKGLGGLTGLGVVSLSPRAVDRIKNRSYPPVAYQTDLLLQMEMWKTPANYRPQSFSMLLLYALREGLATIAREGKENVFQRHVDTTARLERGLRLMGLRNFVKNPKDRMTSFSSFLPPSGKSLQKILSFVLERHGILISDGVGPTKGKILRFVSFADNADMQKIENLLKAVQDALSSPETDMDYTHGGWNSSLYL